MLNIKKVRKDSQATLLRNDVLTAMCFNPEQRNETKVVNKPYKALDGHTYQKVRLQSQITSDGTSLYLTTEVRCTCECDEIIDTSNIRLSEKQVAVCNAARDAVLATKH